MRRNIILASVVAFVGLVPAWSQIGVKELGGKPVFPTASGLDAHAVRRIQSKVGREGMLKALMANSTTRGELEAAAKKSNLKVAELSTKGLDGKHLAASSRGNRVEDLDWANGIRFSVIKYNPKVLDPSDNTLKQLGCLSVDRVKLSNYKDEAAQHASQDLFMMAQNGNADLIVQLPPQSGSYMILVHGLCCKKTYGAAVSVFDHTGEKKLQTVELSSGEGSVGVVNIWPYQVVQGFTGCTIRVHAHESFFFGGITVTRL